MATAVALKLKGCTPERDDKVISAADLKGKAASFLSGLQFHSVYPIDGGFEIFDMQDSVDAFNTHFAHRIGPAIGKEAFAIKPEMQTFESHNSMLQIPDPV